METEEKEKILDALDDKSTAQRLTKEYIDAEKRLTDHLQTLENYGKECDCEDREIVNIIFEDDVPEILTYCINCGGYTEESY